MLTLNEHKAQISAYIEELRFLNSILWERTGDDYTIVANRIELVVGQLEKAVDKMMHRIGKTEE